ncbi:MAG: prolipoprotein diacylglyceryl transferase [Gammaproteobacteria bacterium]|nr:prolipoprotein diacylglyceryl transferase [Gammaproteobacteria bacterium]
MIEFAQIDPVAVRLGPLAVRWYGIMYLVGFAAAWYLGRRRARRPWSPVRPEQIDDLIFYGALGVILGGRIGYMLFYGREQILEDPLALFRIWEGGMSFHGGLLGVLAAMWLYGRSIGTGFCASRTSSRRWCPSAWVRGGSATSSTVNSGAGPPTCPGR